MTGLPAELQRPIIIFWAMKTFSAGISIPRSPLATITPSLSARISSKLTERLGAEDEEGKDSVFGIKKRRMEESTNRGMSRDQKAEAVRTKTMTALCFHALSRTRSNAGFCQLPLDLENILRIVLHCDLNPKSSGQHPNPYDGRKL